MVKGNIKAKKISNTIFRIVGIGASAGGLEATTQLLKALPTNLGMGFVIVQHLDPVHESILAQLLSKTTKMLVKEAEENTQVKPNHVYVIPHNKDMTILNGVLKLTTRKKSNKIHMPIDQFLHSLAEDQKERAIAVILSGTATDGTLGLKTIKSEGGITFAQDQTAKYQGMPLSAIASGSVDFILTPAGIAQELSKMNKHPYEIKPQIPKKEQEFSESEDQLQKIFFILHKSLGIDFRHYKEATVNRRIKRRMLVHKITKLEDYTDYLKLNSDEIEALHDDLLINVTSFFREPETFKLLKDNIFPRLIKTITTQTPIRVWVPGCATGEEVYSIAIMLHEFLSENSLEIPVQIFGTDASRIAIEKARVGKYLRNSVADIAPERLERFFDKTGGTYRINKSIREMCIFAPHNVFGDPPFSKLDLISCCNLLIYLDSVLQDRILKAFHFALKPGGFLMLGKSEAVFASPELFSQIDKKHKIYTRKDLLITGVVKFSPILPKLDKKEINDINVINEVTIGSFDIQKAADKILLSHYTPASVLIDDDLEIVQFRGSTGMFLEPPQGKPSFNLIKMARDGLGFELRIAISKVRKSGKSFRKEEISLKQNGSIRTVSLEVLPLKNSQGESYYLILFEENEKLTAQQVGPLHGEKKAVSHKSRAKDNRINQLEQEILRTREDMRLVTEEQEATNEELQKASEEINSSNEELQSINEELETSKEELESTNEELTTVNEELQNRNEQLIHARDYSEAIIRTVQVPLLILDSELRVKSANRAFHQKFQVTEEETRGNLIYDLGNGQWDIPALRKLLSEILPKNNYFDDYEIEHTFPSIGHKIMLLNARKFIRESENILLAIEDITDRKDIEKQKDMFIGIASHELKTPITTMKGYAQIFEKRLLQRGDSKDIYFIQNINKQADRLTNLVNDLLNTNQIQSGKLILMKNKFDIDAVIKKIVVDFQYAIETHQIIKEGDIKKQVYGDQSRIEQAITNLITNAIKYSPQGSDVIVRLGTNKDNALVTVQDFGFGIEKREQAKVFDRFYRTKDKNEMKVAGFGLGLYISSEIIKGHKGKIWLESTKGKGSKFYFTLPIVEGRKRK